MEKRKTLFDIIGPVIIGPSSSHTAGAVRIGLIAGKIFGEIPKKVKFKLYNSFASTGKGHGTDKGLLGGVLGMDVADECIRSAYEYAKKLNVEYSFEYHQDYNRHPNSVDIIFEGSTQMTISGKSVGAGEVSINRINGYKFSINGDYDTLVLIYKDQPGMIYSVTELLNRHNLNIASMHCNRTEKGQEASMGICIDGVLPNDVFEELKQIEEVYLIRNIEMLKK